MRIGYRNVDGQRPFVVVGMRGRTRAARSSGRRLPAAGALRHVNRREQQQQQRYDDVLFIAFFLFFSGTRGEKERKLSKKEFHMFFSSKTKLR